MKIADPAKKGNYSVVLGRTKAKPEPNRSRGFCNAGSLRRENRKNRTKSTATRSKPVKASP